MEKFRRDKTFISSAGQKIYVEAVYPRRNSSAAVIMAHGLRSYYTGFFNNFSLALVRAGYIVVKFHFVGTGFSSGKFENKLNSIMRQNLKDVIKWTSGLPGIKKIGIVARSNATSLVFLHGSDSRICAYSLLAASVYMRRAAEYYLASGKKVGKYLVHKSFSRSHTKGAGRLPLKYFSELLALDRILLHRVSGIKRAICFQSVNDEFASIEQGDFAYLARHLPEPKRMVEIDAKTHSFHGKQTYVIRETISWFNRYRLTSR